MKFDLEIIIPVKNEVNNLEQLVARIDASMRANNLSYRMIFIDDHSDDGSYEKIHLLANDFPIIARRKVGKPGKAYSILEGSKLAESEFVAMLDADLQYPPEKLPELLQIAKNHGVAVGNRATNHKSFARAFVSKAFRFVFGKVLMGMNVDTQSGIKVFRREIATHITPDDISPWTFDMTLLSVARDLGYSIGSTEIVFAPRISGNSKVRVGRTSLEIGSHALKMRLRPAQTRKIHSPEGLKGAGVVHRRKRYITHTTLPHHISAIRTFTAWQKGLITLVLCMLVVGLLINPVATVILGVAILTLIYFLDVVFSAFVLSRSLHSPPEIVTTDTELSTLDDATLPVYTVLCPLYKEAHILPHFVESMSKLDWPKEKLEIILLLEEDDSQTIRAAQALNLQSQFKIVVVPDSQPKTKPKACNYGLAISTGEYVVIYDAEDQPDSLQLKKVYLAFNKLGPRYGCIQCKLNYFNPNHNLLTRLFTAEYSLWFDVILPGLQSIEGTIPLGGTSNHFRRQDLISFEAWDPFNVTEDCDLGVRLFKAGRKTAIVDSVTLEEANSNVRNWLRQRSRWIKGYFQTYLVHMRNPLRFFATHKYHALIFQLVIGMRMTFMLINPFLWLTTIAYFGARSTLGPIIESLFPPAVFYMAGFALVVGNFMYIYNYMIGLAKRGHWELVKFVFFIPFYWLLASIAAGIALWQLITKPHYWEKTNHGLHLGVPFTPDQMKEEIQETADVAIPVSPTQRFEVPKRESVFAKSIVLIGASGVVSLINLLYSAYLGRSLGLEEFGLLSTIGSIISLVQIPLSTYGSAVVHQAGKLYGKYGFPVKAFWSQQHGKAFLPSLIFTILWVALIPLLTNFFHTDSILPFIFITPVWMTGILASINSGFLSGSHRFAIAGVMTLAESLIKFGLTVFFVQNNMHEMVYAAIPLSLLSSFIFGWIAILFIKDNRQIAVAKKDLTSISKKFMGSAFLTKLSSIGFLTMDLVLAKHFLPPEEAGKYALLSLVGKMVYFLGTLFTQFVNPIVSRNEGAGQSSKKAFTVLISLTSLATLAGFVVFGLIGPYTLPLVFGDKIVSVLPYVALYAFAFGCIAVASGIVNFHQVRGQHSFAFISLLASIYMIVQIILFHNSVYVISLVVAITGIIYLIAVALLHLATSGDNANAASPKRILIFNWRDTKHAWAGGAEVYVHEIAKSWVKQGLEVTLFCGNDGSSAHKEIVDGVQVIRRGGHYTVYFWAFVYYISSLGRKCDVIVESANGLPFFTPLYSGKQVFLIIHHVHQNVFRQHLRFPLSVIASAIEKYLMPAVYRGGRIITVSESTKFDLISLGLTEPEEIEIINPGVQLQGSTAFSKTSYPSFIYMGRLKEYKNIDIAIQAFSEVIKIFPDARLTIAGTGEMMSTLQTLVVKLNISHAVKFMGRVDEYEKAALLAQSWVALQPSSFEGWGITVIEANAAGTPVIASRVVGLKDSIVDGVTGVLVDVKNVNAWSYAMQTLIKNEKQRLHLAKEAKKWSQNFSWQASAQMFLKTIENKRYI